jgi:excisionase family DNA binding protein
MKHKHKGIRPPVTKPKGPQPILGNIHDVAQRLGISVVTARRHLAIGTLPATPIRVGRLLRFNLTELDRLIDEVTSSQYVEELERMAARTRRHEYQTVEE